MSKSQFNTQYGRKVVVDLTPKDIGATDEKQIVKLPQGAVLVSLILLTVVAFNSETTATATIKDETATLVNAVDLKTVGSETVAGVPKFYPAGGTLEFVVAETGTAATQGRALAIVEYVIVGGTDEIYGWPAGINNVAAEGSMPRNELGVPIALREAVNVDLTPEGRLRLRRGHTGRVPGVLVHSLWSSNELDFGLYVDAGQLHMMATDEVVTPLGVEVGNYPLSYALVGDRILYSNRTHSGMITLPDLGLHAWAPELPDSVPHITTVDGYGLTPGQYQIAVTLTDMLRRESGAGIAQVVEVADGQGILLSGLPTNATGRINVYVSGPNDQVLRLHTSVPAGSGMHLIATEAEGVKLGTSLLDPMPSGQICRVYNGRHWVADGRTVRWSPPFRYGMTDLAHALMRFDADIDLLEPWGAGEGAGLFVAAGKRTYWLAGATPDQFRLVDVHAAGAIPGTSLKVPGQSIGMDDDAERLIWTSRKGVYVIGHEGGRVTAINDGRAVMGDAARGASLLMERDGIRSIVTTMKGPRASGLAVTDTAVAHVIHTDR